MDFECKYRSHVDIVNKKLDGMVPEKDCLEKDIHNAMRYSLMAGGKRLRPVLMLGVGEMLDGRQDEVLLYACAIEMIHTYSLIHDDLPAMDDDDYRRGRPTNHRVFGEAKAVLAGDALLNLAFEAMLCSMQQNDGNVAAKIKAASIIAKSSGVSGMIAGQVVDLESEGREISAGTLEYMHRCKTGALIKASVLSAAILSNASDDTASCLEQYADSLGLAFQIRDDILDIEGDPGVMGKKGGSDAANKKSTFVTVFGLDESKKMLRDVTSQAVTALDPFGEKADFLVSLAGHLVTRKK